MVFVVGGIGGVVVLLLGILIVVLMMRGNGAENVPAKAPAVADAPLAEPVAPVITRTAAVAETPDAVAPSPVLDSVEVARRLKDATVYLKNKIAGKTFASGSGFVIDVHGSQVVVATNRHVVDTDLSELPARLVPKGAKIEIEAVFRSAQGPNQEESHPAQIIAADSSGNISKDLAFLMVNDVKRPPKPLDVLKKSDATEGMTYTAAGFPFGGILSKVNESKGNPGVTITGGRISRLVKDDFGLLDLYQVDGSMQPGNSGGPVVEEKTGKFVGVVVAKMGSVDTIGFVVPADELRGALAGRVGGLMMELKDIQASSASLQIKAQIVDPKAKVKDVLIHVAPASAGSVSPNGDGTWPPLPNTTAVQLQARSQVRDGGRECAGCAQWNRRRGAKDRHSDGAPRSSGQARLCQAQGDRTAQEARPDPRLARSHAHVEGARAREHHDAGSAARSGKGLQAGQG